MRDTFATCPVARFQTWKYRRRADRKMRGSLACGWKAVVVRAVAFTTRVVRRVEWSGGWSCRWYRSSFEEGPEVMRRGRVGWSWSEVMADYFFQEGNWLAS